MRSDLPAHLAISAENWRAVQTHVQNCLPEEACGLLGGVYGEEVSAALVIPVENTLHSPVKFRMNPGSQLRAFQAIEEHALDLVAIFHSHPQGPPHPSPSDCAEFAYPGVLTVILFPGAQEPGSAWQGRAFLIEGVLDAAAPYREILIQITPQ